MTADTNLKSRINSFVENITIQDNSNILLCKYSAEWLHHLKKTYPTCNIDCLADNTLEFFLDNRNLEDISCYDVIIDDGLLEAINWDKNFLRALGFHLAQPHGKVYFIFQNIEHWSKLPITPVLDYEVSLDATSGALKHSDVIRCLYKAGYEQWKDVFYLGNEVSDEYMACYPQIGVNLGIIYFVVEAGYFQQIAAWLQSFYTDEFRRNLAYNLQRIDFQIRQEESIAVVKSYLAEGVIDKTYLDRFICSACIHRDRVKHLLGL